MYAPDTGRPTGTLNYDWSCLQSQSWRWALQWFLFYDYRNRFFGGRLVSRLVANSYVKIFVSPSFTATPLCIDSRIEQKVLYFSGGFRRIWRMHCFNQPVFCCLFCKVIILYFSLKKFV